MTFTYPSHTTKGCVPLSSDVTAAYYNTYSTVATIPNGNGCNRAQGFAVGSSYVYTAKCNDDESKQVIYRTKISDGSTTLMTNGKTSATYITSLGHANDMATFYDWGSQTTTPF